MTSSSASSRPASTACAGADAVVFEARAADGGDGGGAFLTLQINGMDALRALDAYDVVADLGFDTPLIRLFSSTGRKLGVVPTGGTAEDGTTSQTWVGPTCTG